MDDLVRGLVPARRSDEHLPVNIGNPQRAHAARARADRDRASPARRARSSSRRCRSTTRRCASPTSRAPSSCSAGSREVSLEDGLRRMLQSNRTGVPECLSALAGRRVRDSSPPSPWRPRRRPPRPRRRAVAVIMLVGINDEPRHALRRARDRFATFSALHVQVSCASTSTGAATVGRRELEAVRPDRPERPGVQLVALRPARRIRATPTTSRCCSRSCSRRRGRTAALRERSRRRTTPTSRTSRTPRPSATAALDAAAWQRDPQLGSTAPRCRRSASGRPGTSRTTRSSSRRSTSGSARSGSSRAVGLRQDLQRDLQGRALAAPGPYRRQGRLRRDRPARQQRPAQARPSVDAARLPHRGQDGRD